MTRDATVGRPRRRRPAESPKSPASRGSRRSGRPRWDAAGTYPSTAPPPATGSSPSTPRPPPCRDRSTSATSSPTPTPTPWPASSGCGARPVFYPMGWDDNGLPTERRVQNYFGVRCDPTPPLRPGLRAARPSRPRIPIAVSRPNFVELCHRLTAEDEQAFEHLWRTPRPLGRLVPHLLHRRRPGPPGVPAGFLRLPDAGPGRTSARRPPCGTSTSAPPSPRPSWRTASAPAPTTGSASPGVRRRRRRRHRDHPARAARRPAWPWWPTPTTTATGRCSAPRSSPPSSACGSRCWPTSWPTPRRAPASPWSAPSATPPTWCGGASWPCPPAPSSAGTAGCSRSSWGSRGWESDDPGGGRRRLRGAGRPDGQAGPDPHRRAAGASRAT